MSTSKFDELVAILSEDYRKTEEYLERTSNFIEQLTLKLDDYIGCGLGNLFCFIEEGEKNKAPVENNIESLMAENLIVVTDDFCFVFPLMIQIKSNSFDNPHWNPSFKKSYLAPPSKVVLFLTIEQQEENLFSVTAPIINEEEQVEEKIFLITPKSEDSWNELVESCFKVIKKTIEGGLEKRLRESLIKTDDTPQRVFRLP